MTTHQEVQHLKGQIKCLCEDWAEHHTAAQKLALDMGISKERVEGDSYAVPGIADLLDMIRERHFAALKSAEVLWPALDQHPMTSEEKQSLDEFTQAELSTP